jgi:hypothetical protein
VDYLVSHYALNKRRACRLVKQNAQRAVLPQRQRPAPRFAYTDARNRAYSSALWLSAHPRPAETRGLAAGQKSDVPALPLDVLTADRLIGWSALSANAGHVSCCTRQERVGQAARKNRWRAGSGRQGLSVHPQRHATNDERHDANRPCDDWRFPRTKPRTLPGTLVGTTAEPQESWGG